MEAAVGVLRFGIAVTMIIYGIHQLWKPEEWFGYLPKWLTKLLHALPWDLKTDMRLHGIGNLGLGIVLLFGIFDPFIYWVTLAWWLSILPFAFYYEWQSGMRDVTIITGIIALILLR